MDDRETIQELIDYEESVRMLNLEKEVREELFGVSLDEGDIDE